MLINLVDSRWLSVVALLVISLTMPVVYADDDEDDRGVNTRMSAAESGGQVDERQIGIKSKSKKSRKPMVSNAKWKDECGACHLAYPPRFLSPDSWRAVMSGLSKHFGSDASLDATTASEIGDFLVKNASTKKRRSSTGNEPALRISETRWFQSEHRKVANSWKNPRVKSMANCAACHTKAESGSFRERDISVPK